LVQKVIRLLAEIGTELGYDVPQGERSIMIDRALRISFRPDLIWTRKGGSLVLFEFEPRFQPKKVIASLVLASELAKKVSPREKLTVLFLVLPKTSQTEERRVENILEFLRKNFSISGNLETKVLVLPRQVTKSSLEVLLKEKNVGGERGCLG
jgi:hypothetical protein